MGVSKPGLDANVADEIIVFARVLDPQGLPLVGVSVGFAADFPDASFFPSETPPDGVSQTGFPSSAALTDYRGVAQITPQLPVLRLEVLQPPGQIQPQCPLAKQALNLALR